MKKDILCVGYSGGKYNFHMQTCEKVKGSKVDGWIYCDNFNGNRTYFIVDDIAGLGMTRSGSWRKKELVEEFKAEHYQDFLAENLPRLYESDHVKKVMAAIKQYCIDNNIKL